MFLLAFYVALALGVSFLCSIMEAVLLSVTPSFVAMEEQRGAPTAARLRALKTDVDRPLAAILSLNTIAHTVGAAGAGAQAAVVFGSASVAIASAAMTLLILVLSEIIPKTLGAVHWRSLAPVVVRLLGPVIWLMWPLVKLSQLMTRVMAGDRARATVSRDEMSALAEQGLREGVLAEDESRILKNLMLFRTITAKMVMTPRTVVQFLPEAATVGEVVAGRGELPFSRLPVYRTDHDDVTGFVLKDEILLRAARDELTLPLREIRRAMRVVPETLPLPDLLARLVADKDHIALVADEFGGTAGIVTLEDLLETLLGLEIVDEADATRDMQELARQRWRSRARDLRRLGAGASRHGDRIDPVIRFGLTGGRPAPPPEDDGPDR